MGALEEFAQKLAGVVRRFIRLKGWREVERIVIGGGFRRAGSASSPSAAHPSR